MEALMTRVSLLSAVAFILVYLLVGTLPMGGASRALAAPRPVIFDTDICDDIDDTWALAVLLQSPELDCRLVTTAVGNTAAKARVVAKYLQEAGRSDIPIGVGGKQHDGSAAI
jgi:hypothetical protein